MSIVLTNQIEATERSTEALNDELLKEHRDAMFCYDVQDLIRSVTNLFCVLNLDVERWRADPASQIEGLSPNWNELYRRLNTLCPDCAKLIAAVEHDGRSIEGKVEFLNVWKDLRGIAIFSSESVISSAGQIARGEIHSLEAVKNELWGDSLEQSKA